MNIAEVVEFINSHDDPTLTEEMNALVMETCYRTHRLTMQLNNTYYVILHLINADEQLKYPNMLSETHSPSLSLSPRIPL